MSTQPSRRSNLPARSGGARRDPALSRRDRLFQPSTIDYTCKRCGLSAPSAPLPTDPKALRVYGLPSGWELGSAIQYELGPSLVICPRDAEDFSLCAACAEDLRRGYPLDLRDLGR